MEVSTQLTNEKNYRTNKFIQEDVGEKTNKILDELEQEKNHFQLLFQQKSEIFMRIKSKT